jgi:amyloid beta precursor protein binding protein 1
VRQYGLIGTLRVFKAENTVIESKPDQVQIDDLRLANPFPSLKEYADSFKFEELDSQEHGHVPYSVILIRAL